MLPALNTASERVVTAGWQITKRFRERKSVASWVAVALVVGALIPSVAEALWFLGCDWEIVGNCIVGYCDWPIIGEFTIRICIV